MYPSQNRIYRVYKILSGDDHPDRSCERIPESTCTRIPLNYVLNVVNGAASKMAEQVASAKVAIPWLLTAIGAPAFLVGMLLPLRQAGTLLPQLMVSGQIRRFPLRKWFWVVSALIQVLMLSLMIMAALTLPPTYAGLCVAAFLLVFSLARGVGSLSFQDVTGKTIPKGRRGRLLAARSMIGGLLAIVVGIGLRWIKSDDEEILAPVLLLACGALLWIIAALAFASIREEPGATEGGRNAINEALAGLRAVANTPWYKRFLLARTALLSIELSAPFYVLYISANLPMQAGTLGMIVIATGLAAALSSPIWGRFADLSSRSVMIIGGLMGAATGIIALIIAIVPATMRNSYAYLAIFVLLGFSEAGVLLGRKTYLLDRVNTAERSTYVAFANTAMGVMTLLFGLLGVIAHLYGIKALIVILILLGLSGAIISASLPETSSEPTSGLT